MNVLLIDDHPVIRSAVGGFLKEHGFDVVGEASDGITALKIIEEVNPDIIILDIDIPKLDGLEVLKRLRRLSKDYRVLVLTGIKSDEIAARCVHAGASGYLSKASDMTELLDACKALKRDHTWFSKDVLNSVRNQDFASSEAQLLSQLSAREMSILRSLVQGESNTQIAEALHLSAKTVSTYRSRLQQKLHINGLIEMAELAKRNGLL